MGQKEMISTPVLESSWKSQNRVISKFKLIGQFQDENWDNFHFEPWFSSHEASCSNIFLLKKLLFQTTNFFQYWSFSTLWRFWLSVLTSVLLTSRSSGDYNIFFKLLITTEVIVWEYSRYNACNSNCLRSGQISYHVAVHECNWAGISKSLACRLKCLWKGYPKYKIKIE